MELNEKDIVVMSGGNKVPSSPAPAKKKKRLHKRYIFNIIIVLLIAAVVLYFSLKDGFDDVVVALKTADARILIVVAIVAVGVFLLDGLILYILARLYTTRYSFGKGLANAFIGVFYNDVTPSSSGGQFAQAYTFKKQGLELASAASILVMHFLLYQIVLVAYGILALFIKLPAFLALNPVADFGGFKLTLIPLSLLGFGINFFVIVTILLLSYSKWMHSVAINGIVSIGAKLKFIKHPEKTKQNWQAQIENFRIELRRLQSNIPVTILLLVLFTIKLTLSYSIPYLIGVSLAETTMAGHTYFDTVFFSAYLQMMTNMIPLPGASGFSEYFFTQVFVGIYGNGALATAAQLIWRTATFYLGLIIGGFVTAFYRSSPQEDNFKTDRKTFVELQKSTYELRKKTADTMFQTSQLSRKDIEKRMSEARRDIFGTRKRREQKKTKQQQAKTGLVEINDEGALNPLDSATSNKGEE